MERNGWLVWTKKRLWRLYLPRADRNLTGQTLSFGASRLPVPVTQRAIQPGEFAFPVRLNVMADGRLHLPPLLGIMTSKHQQKQGFRGNRANFRDIIETGRRKGVPVCVFVPEDLTDHRPHALAYTRHPTFKKWLRLPFPLPDVVYNRIPDREAEQQAAEQRALHFLHSHHQIELFNPHFFDKEEIFYWLAQERALTPFLPTTDKWNTLPLLINYVTNHDIVYIKPTKGKAGAGIMRAKKERDGFSLTYVNGKTNQLVQYRTKQVAHLYSEINRLIKKQPYLIQQGVSLARYQGRPFDLRLLVQKNGAGHWGVTGLGIRVAGARGITTHVPRGGRIGNVEEILPRVFGSHAKDIHRRATQLGVLVAQGIEKQSGHSLGEISIDLGVDRNKAMWLFEANAKPMKFDEPSIRRRSLERLIDYSTYLFARRRPLHRDAHS